uniref:hypothetical protein n=1 Tax=Alicycliphilus soli TaxID=3228789 RepID=UPI003F84D93B
MRMGFGLVGLLLALAVVAVLVKKQTGATRMAQPPAVQGQPADGALPSVRTQGRQLQQDVKQQLDGLMQQPRVLIDEEK